VNKLVALLALGLIVSGFLLVTFSYAAPTSPTGTNGLPDVSDTTHGTGRPEPPNDSVPSDAKTDEITPPDTTPPDTTPPTDDTTPLPPDYAPPGESYVTHYVVTNLVIPVAYNANFDRYEGKDTAWVNYPVTHHHEVHLQASVSNGMTLKIGKAGQYLYTLGPTTGTHILLSQSESVEDVVWNFFVSGNNAQGSATVSVYVTEWPSSRLSIFGSSTYDMTIGVVMLIAGFAALLLFGRH
jgi:hypothetical protein